MRSVVGLYDRFDDAMSVVRALTAAGIRRDDISIMANDQNGEYSRHLEDKSQTRSDSVADGAASGAGIGAVLGGLGGLLVGLGALAIPGIGPVLAAGPLAAALAGAGIGAAAGGIVGALVDLGIPEEQANLYAEGVRRGGTLVIARIDDRMVDRTVEIMNRFNPVDIKKRSADWRENQWTGFNPEAKPYTNKDLELERSRYGQENVPVTGQTNDMTIPVVEEDIQVGKREVDRGGVRINSYTTEEPVEKDVTLRNEKINVDRRPADREATDADFNAFKEGSMELRETTEEPVVQKSARVVEEVHVNKDVEEHDETIRDSVRRKDVDVEQISGQGSRQSGDWSRFDQMYQQDFRSRFGNTGRDYSYYQPAYRYGYDLRMNPQYRDYDWARIEPVARADWERRGSRTRWEEIRDAVRHAWDSARR